MGQGGELFGKFSENEMIVAIMSCMKDKQDLQSIVQIWKATIMKKTGSSAPFLTVCNPVANF